MPRARKNAVEVEGSRKAHRRDGAALSRFLRWFEENGKTGEVTEIDAAKKVADKMKSGEGFDLNDFLTQISQMKKMGGLSGLMDKLPSQLTAKAGQLGPADMDRAERDVRRMEGIICSMTPGERRKPELIKATRKRRIAAGAGVQVQEVNRLLNQFEQMRGMMKKMQGGGLAKLMRRFGGAGGMGGPGGMGGMRGF